MRKELQWRIIPWNITFKFTCNTDLIQKKNVCVINKWQFCAAKLAKVQIMLEVLI